ncbi:MAG: GyrI-like domain-containing protein [Flavobacteriaceae bacterium]|nr:GyrI-like domain-containing protein [Flavobacteriaceae bacterium]
MMVFRRKYAWKQLIFILIGLFFVWYLVFKQHDYEVRFKAKTSPGTLYTMVEEWNLIRKQQGKHDYELLSKTPYDVIFQKIEYGGSEYELEWRFESLNDSITEVTMGYYQPGRKVYNRLTAPFLKTKFKEDLLFFANEYKTGLDFTLKEKFRVHSVNLDTIPEMSYAYLQLKGIPGRDKAANMMKNNSYLLQILQELNLKKKGYPFLFIENWDKQNNILDFRFCYQIEPTLRLPAHVELKYDIAEARPALKAIYNGNYIYSDRGWFALYEYAKRHKIDCEQTPLEIFHNNPFSESNEIKWITEIYLPLKD